MKNILSLVILLMICSVSTETYAQKKNNKKKNQIVPPSAYDEGVYDAMKWRNVGPFRGGRSAAVTGVAGKPNLYYLFDWSNCCE